MVVYLHGARRVLRCLPGETVFWTAGLVALALTDPTSDGLLDLCIFKRLGISWCPGCGLGHAVAYLFRGDLLQSFQTHPFGIPAVMILVARVVDLVRDAVRRAAVFPYHQNT